MGIPRAHMENSRADICYFIRRQLSQIDEIKEVEIAHVENELTRCICCWCDMRHQKDNSTDRERKIRIN